MFPLHLAPHSQCLSLPQRKLASTLNRSDSLKGRSIPPNKSQKPDAESSTTSRSVKDLTDWQFAEQCDIAGLDQSGAPKRMSDEEVHSAQRAMDQETVLARTRAMNAVRRAEEMSNSPISPRALSSRGADWRSMKTHPQKRSGLAARKGTAHCTSKPARSMS